MLTVKYINSGGVETLYPDIEYTSWEKNRLFTKQTNGDTITFGPLYVDAKDTPVNPAKIYVMNGTGSTVAHYTLLPEPWPEG